MKFLVIEGVDGSGKSTQMQLLMEYLAKKEIAFRYLHFPRTDSRVYGSLIGRFLRGDFGRLNEVDPYLVALLYAGDRQDAAQLIRQWLKDELLVVLDRYVYSNVAFQCAKVSDPEERKRLLDWILDLEYTYHGIPKPDLNILLDVPFAFTQQKLMENRDGTGRDYLQGQRDIHEDDLGFQQRVREMYLWQAKLVKDFKIVSCVDAEGGMLDPNAIHSLIIREANL